MGSQIDFMLGTTKCQYLPLCSKCSVSLLGGSSRLLKGVDSLNDSKAVINNGGIGTSPLSI